MYDASYVVLEYINQIVENIMRALRVTQFLYILIPQNLTS